MEKHQFKTTINCGGCLAKVSPHLDANTDIKHWDVDINNPEKVLTVEAENLTQKDIKELVQKLGFKAEQLP